MTTGGGEYLVTTRLLPTEGVVTRWREGVRIPLADPSLTIVDMLDDPALGPGIRETGRTLVAYLRSDSRRDDVLLRYADERGNGAVFKRLGFLLERLAPAEEAMIAACRTRLTHGYAKLDPAVPAADRRRLARWRIIENVRGIGEPQERA